MNPSGDLLQQHRMLDIVEVARSIHVNDRGHAPQHAAPDFRQGTVRGPLGSESVGVRAEIRLEDRFEDELQCPLHHAIADAGNLKRPDFAIVLGYIHPAVLLGFVCPGYQVLTNIFKESISARGLDIIKCHAVDTVGNEREMKLSLIK